jgi:hypothetical protein
MEFFGKFFGGKKGGSSPEEKKPETKKTPDPSRRDFLKFGAGVAGAVALEKTALGNTIKSESKESVESLLNLEQELVDKLNVLGNVMREAQRKIFRKRVREFSGKKNDMYYGFEKEVVASLTPEESMSNRNDFLSEVKQPLDDFFNKFVEWAKVTRLAQKQIKIENFRTNIATNYKVLINKMSEEEWEKAEPGEKSDRFVKETSSSGEVSYTLSGEVDLGALLEYKIYNSLKQFDCHGLVYKLFSDSGLYTQANKILGRNWELDQGRMTYKSNDFLPAAAEISPEEIDPFIFITKNRKDVTAKDVDRSKWGKAEYQKKFRDVLDNTKIRERLKKEPDFTHADSCSLIKSVIEYKERGLGNGIGDEVILDLLISERRKFEDEVWLDGSTDTIRFYGHDTTWDKLAGKNMFDAKPMDEIVNITGSKSDQIIHAEKFSNPAQIFLNAIKKARGKTLIYIETHGNPNYLSTDVDAQKDDIKLVDLARNLKDIVFDVLEKEGLEAAYLTLAEFKIFSGACFGYDAFFEEFPAQMHNLLQEELRRRLKKKMGNTPAELAIKNFDINKVRLPRKITLSQKGNLVFDFFQKALVSHKGAIKKQGKIRGKDLLAIQPEVYALGGDMSFSSSKDGQIYQISEVEKHSQDRAV